tara:strand:+ start:5880 stop:7499 length:1620 start_codon:yes stop_codon:yes gene_type:complete
MNKMKRILQLVLVFILAFSCGSNGSLKKSKGELVGVKGKKYYPEKPFGMVLVPGGSFIMGKSDDDLAAIEDAPTKTVTVRSFYMDETEITNAEYRQFVNWVRDSIIRTALAEKAAELNATGPVDNTGEEEDNSVMQRFAYLGSENALTGYQKFDSIYNDNSNKRLNWSEELIFNRGDYPDDMDYIQLIESFYLTEDEVFNNVRTWDVEKFIYKHKYANLSGDGGYLDKKERVTRELIESLIEEGYVEESEGGSFPTFILYEGGNTLEVEDKVEITDKFLAEFTNGELSRSQFVREVPVPVYPDTTVWIKDFKYSYNEPMHNDYFWHDAYSDYPVVGVTWHQAKAFCEWRTLTKNSYQKTKKKKSLVPKFRLPTEAEWEYAARGGLQGASYPWGGPYTKDDRGCFMANFKPMRGDYAVDQALYTVEANSYDPNGYSLYNMSGNVAEWVDSSYEPEAYDFSITMNPNVNKEGNNKKVIRGGSWKDVKYFLQVSSRDYEYADQPRSYIGFRTVHDYLGADMTANQMVNDTDRKRNNKKSSIK